MLRAPTSLTIPVTFGFPYPYTVQAHPRSRWVFPIQRLFAEKERASAFSIAREHFYGRPSRDFFRSLRRPMLWQLARSQDEYLNLIFFASPDRTGLSCGDAPAPGSMRNLFWKRTGPPEEEAPLYRHWLGRWIDSTVQSVSWLPWEHYGRTMTFPLYKAEDLPRYRNEPVLGFSG